MKSLKTKSIAEASSDNGVLRYLREAKSAKWALLGILAFVFVTRVVRLGEPADFYFDEVYHGFTATQYLNNPRDAYDPWAKPPEGKAYEWTHPPLAKLAMAATMEVVGQSPFGWRLSSVLFGVLATYLTALLAFELLGSWLAALLAAAFFSLEGMILAQSRIAMNDIHFVAFTLASILFYVKWKKSPEKLALAVLASVFVGMAVATKWTAFYLWGILAADFWIAGVFSKNHPVRRSNWPAVMVMFVLIPPVIYLLSYTHYFALGYSWEQFKELQRQMWWYHTRLDKTHSYQSTPLHWIFNLKPVWMYVSYAVPGKIANIYNLGNSVILLGGLYFMLKGFLSKDRWTWGKKFLTFCYFGLWVPWAFSPRIMLFYHYAPAIPFLCMELGRVCDGFLGSGERRQRLAAYALLTAAFAWFVVFYAHAVAIPVPKGFADAVYFALPGWK